MSKKNKLNKCSVRVFAAGLAALLLFGVVQFAGADDAKTSSSPKDANAAETGKKDSGKDGQSGQTSSSSPDATGKPAKKAPRQLTGAELYSMHCARCHPERYPNERTSAQWKTIGLHMRVRANLPAEHFRKLLKYLQENSGY